MEEKKQQAEKILKAIEEDTILTEELRKMLEKQLEERLKKAKQTRKETEETIDSIAFSSKNTGFSIKESDSSREIQNEEDDNDVMIFCTTKEEALKKIEELKLKYPDRKFEITPISKKDYQALLENRVKEKIKSNLNITNDKFANEIIEGLLKNGEAKVKNIEINDPETNQLKTIKDAVILLKKDDKSKKMVINVRYIKNAEKLDEVYISRTGEEKNSPEQKTEINVQVESNKKISKTKIDDVTAPQKQNCTDDRIKKIAKQI